MKEEQNLEGLGGWLILVGVGLVTGPMEIIGGMITGYSEIFPTGVWEKLTTQGSPAYDPLWAPIIITEIIVNSIIILASLYMLYLFFSKKSSFPKWYIGLAVFGLLFIVADALAVKLVLPDIALFDSETVKNLMSSLGSVVIWVPYMLVSERVKATFVNE